MTHELLILFLGHCAFTLFWGFERCSMIYSLEHKHINCLGTVFTRNFLLQAILNAKMRSLWSGSTCRASYGPLLHYWICYACWASATCTHVQCTSPVIGVNSLLRYYSLCLIVEPWPICQSLRALLKISWEALGYAHLICYLCLNFWRMDELQLIHEVIQAHSTFSTPNFLSSSSSFNFSALIHSAPTIVNLLTQPSFECSRFHQKLQFTTYFPCKFLFLLCRRGLQLLWAVTLLYLELFTYTSFIFNLILYSVSE